MSPDELVNVAQVIFKKGVFNHVVYRLPQARHKKLKLENKEWEIVPEGNSWLEILISNHIKWLNTDEKNTKVGLIEARCYPEIFFGKVDYNGHLIISSYAKVNHLDKDGKYQLVHIESLMNKLKNGLTSR
jgi:hypothetical protein